MFDLSPDQVADAEAADVAFPPATPAQVQRLSMQKKVFRVGGEPVLATLGGALFETASTLERLITDGNRRRRVVSVSAPAPAPAAEPLPCPRRPHTRNPASHMVAPRLLRPSPLGQGPGRCRAWDVGSPPAPSGRVALRSTGTGAAGGGTFLSLPYRSGQPALDRPAASIVGPTSTPAPRTTGAVAGRAE